MSHLPPTPSSTGVGPVLDALMIRMEIPCCRGTVVLFSERSRLRTRRQAPRQRVRERTPINFGPTGDRAERDRENR
jgi:hypothetical protein